MFECLNAGTLSQFSRLHLVGMIPMFQSFSRKAADMSTLEMECQVSTVFEGLNINNLRVFHNATIDEGVQGSSLLSWTKSCQPVR